MNNYSPHSPDPQWANAQYSQQQYPQQQYSQQQYEPQEPAPQPSGKSPWPIIIAVILGLILLAGLGWLAYTLMGSDDKDNDAKSAAVTSTAEKSESEKPKTDENKKDKNSKEDEAASDRCSADFLAKDGWERYTSVMECDGEWLYAGVPQTDDTVVLRWDSNSWARYPWDGKAPQSGYDCFDPAKLDADGMPDAIRENVTKCSSTKDEDTKKDAETCGASASEAVSRWAPGLDFGVPGVVPSLEYAGTGEYDPCAALSYIVVPVEGATGSSPVHIMLFHHGDYLGTATAKGYKTSNISTVSDDTISATYKYPLPGESGPASSGEAFATFTWDESAQKVQMSGDVPPT